MSREVRRVPLDFDAPIDKTWWGYVRPEALRLPECRDCRGAGFTTAALWLDAMSMLIAMLGNDDWDHRRGSPMHPYLTSIENHPGAWHVPPRVSEDIHVLLKGLTGDDPSWLGYSSHSVFTAITEAAGVPEKWGWCTTCDGTGRNPTPQQQAAYDAWEPTLPPAGEGWQLWQTVSEGGPVSPVFEAAEGLAQWLTTEAAGMDRMPDIAGARRMVEIGWAPSGGSHPEGGHMTGTVLVGYVTDPQRERDAEHQEGTESDDRA